MISRVKIENYKSIESADFEARRVNVFIGEPNSGKSNLLEAVGALSRGIFPIDPVLYRIRHTADLFFDREQQRIIFVRLEGETTWKLTAANDRYELSFNTHGEVGKLYLGSSDLATINEESRAKSDVRYYRYRPLTRQDWQSSFHQYLRPPYGLNLPTLLGTSKSIRDSISAFFQEKGFRLHLYSDDSEIQMTKDVDGVLHSFPFESISETMRRIVFYKAALESNKDAILVFDEPESNTFPFCTKYLAERIALDESNQFFLTTHNPYVLMSIIEKTPSVDLAVYVTRMRNYRTELKLLESTQLGEALELGMSVFFNLDSYFED